MAFQMTKEDPEPEVVTNTQECLKIVKTLNDSDIIVLDAEGVNLGKDGPLTLLQIGTWDRKVYLFDIHTNKMLFTQGKLKDILQSEKITKVIHSCAGDSAALYHQFGIELKNVFDTQVAHHVLQGAKGRKLPSSVKLEVLCQIYSQNAPSLKKKDYVKVKMLKEDGEYWSRRPLTAEMIEYASNDILVLIPEVYSTLKRLLEDQNLLNRFNEEVYEEINIGIRDDVRKARQDKTYSIARDLLSKFENKFAKNVILEDIQDEDDLKAMEKVRYNDKGIPPLVKRLKEEDMWRRMEELNEELLAKGDDFVPTQNSYGYLKAYQYHPDENIQREAKRLQKELNRIFLNDIPKKYDESTNFKVLHAYEKDALQTLRPNSENDRRFHKIQLSLYWQMEIEDVKTVSKRLEEEGKNLDISPGKYNWFKNNVRRSIPRELKQKIESLLKRLDDIFGPDFFVQKTQRR